MDRGGCWSLMALVLVVDGLNIRGTCVVVVAVLLPSMDTQKDHPPLAVAAVAVEDGEDEGRG